MPTKDISEIRQALSRLCTNKRRFCIPIQPDDDDMVLVQAVDELVQLREQNVYLQQTIDTIKEENKNLQSALKAETEQNMLCCNKLHRLKITAERTERQYLKVNEIVGKFRKNIETATAALQKAKKFTDNIMSFYGQNLCVYNWHLNGDGEPWDNFFDENMDGDEQKVIDEAFGRLTQGQGDAP